MAEGSVRNRFPQSIKTEESTSKKDEEHPAGPVPHGGLWSSLRALAFASYFLMALLAIHSCQILGLPLYWINKDYFYTYMAFTKQQFGLLINNITQWFSPTTIRISAADDVADEIRLAPDGRLETTFPNRLILTANHQIYTDWLYLWWISYTSHAHGHIYIILKETLRYLPLLGPGMMLYGFIFLARNWLKDKPRFQHHMQRLKSTHKGPLSGPQKLDPMWLLIFPEGTNLSANGRKTSATWAEKQGMHDMAHLLLPRTTGLQFCLAELKDTVDWIYDCTIAYEGIPRGQYGQDLFTLRSIYFQGRAPKSVNMHWRRFRVAEIPIEETERFEKWLLDRWREKDALVEGFMQRGRFPPNPPAGDKEGRRKRGAYYETEVQQRFALEFLVIFAPCLGIIAAGLVMGRLFT